MNKKKKLLLKSLLCVAAGSFLAGCGGTSNIIPPSPLVEFTQTAPSSIVWTNSVGNGNDSQGVSMAPIAFAKTVYTVSYNGEVYATNSNTGSTIWSTDLDQSLTSTPGVSEKYVFVGSLLGKLFALDRSTGKQLWSTKIPSSLFGAPVYYQGTVIVSTHNGAISAYNAKTGKQIWSQSVGTPTLMLAGNSSPVIVNGMVIVGFSNGELWAFNLKTGNKLWDMLVAVPKGDSEITRMVDINATPILDNGALYVATYQGNVVAINAKNGALMWTHKFSSYTDMSISNGDLFITNAKGDVVALDQTTGRKIWEQKILTGRNVTGPAVIGNYVAVADFKGYVHFFNRSTGEYVSRIEVDSDGISSQAINVDGKLIVQTNDGELAAIKI